MQVNLWLSGYQDWVFSFAQADKGCFMERYEELFQRTKCILEAFIILPVLLTGMGITLEHTPFLLLHLNRKDTPGNPQF